MFKKSKRSAISRFHAAEHMALDAYERKQRIPTGDEIKSSSRFSPDCGSMHTFNAIFYKTFLCVYLYFMLKICLAIYDYYSMFGSVTKAILMVVLTMVLGAFLFSQIVNFTIKKALMRFMQFAVTKKPTDREVRLAREALINYEIMEKTIEGNIVFSSKSEKT